MGQGSPVSNVVNRLLGREMRQYCTTDKTPGTSQNGVVVVPPYEPNSIITVYKGPGYVMSVQALIAEGLLGNFYLQVFDAQDTTRASDPSNFNPFFRSPRATSGQLLTYEPPKEGTEYVPRPGPGEPCRSGADFGQPFENGLTIALSTALDLVTPAAASSLWLFVRFRPFYDETEARPWPELRGPG